jgi:cytochrome b6-f complex iron-sulfur subunit
MKRRTFLDWLTGAAGALVGASVLYPVMRYLVPPRIPEATTDRVVAAHVDELKPDSAKTFAFGSTPGILIRTKEGDYRAFTAVCTHLGCTVQFKASDNLIWCACHNGYYDLNGRNVAGPPPRPLTEYEVHIEGSDVVVTKGKAT